jgi:hypothetical protein
MWRETFVIVVGSVPAFCTVTLRKLGLLGGGGIITIPANAVTRSFGPDVSFVYTFHAKLPRPLNAPTHAAHCVAFMPHATSKHFLAEMDGGGSLFETTRAVVA